MKGGRVLLTGASSFSGMHIARSLAKAGLEVVAPLRRAAEDYDGVRLDRTRQVAAVARVIHSCPIGSDALAAVVRSEGPWLGLAHHASEVSNYSSWRFDLVGALDNNLRGMQTLVRLMADNGASHMVATGTVFEAGEGAAGRELAANPYGLSKTLANIAFEHMSAWSGLGFGKFVVANPFGTFEERRFGAYLFSRWLTGQTALVRTPDYVRDNIPVSLLARAYADYFSTVAVARSNASPCRPSGFVGRQVAFAQEVAKQVSARSGLECRIECEDQKDFSEPYSRTNSLRCCFASPEEEVAFWDEYTDYYFRIHRSGNLLC